MSHGVQAPVVYQTPDHALYTNAFVRKIPIRPNMRHTIMSETVKYLSTLRQQAALIPKSVSSLPQAPSRPVAVGKTV
jgi:hypothetical protein